MADTKSELNDIILNKSDSSFSGFKKILLAVASFAVLLIIVVVVMSSINNDPKNNLTNTIVPPEPINNVEDKSDLFKAVTVDKENSDDEQKRLESIANEIKQQTLPPVVDPQQKVEVPNNEVITIGDPYEEPAKKEIKEPVKKAEVKKESVKAVEPAKEVKKESKAKKGIWYVQVGSFERLQPHKRLIAKIKRLGYEHIQYKSVVKGNTVTKLLIGPYATYKDAKKARTKIRAEIQPAAYIYQMVK